MSISITPKGLRLHIGIFGRRNVGKSSLLNALTRQQTSIVSDIAGTTTDPVEKPMELLPIGPVQFIDTAGVDDVGALGELRIQKTRQVFDRTDIGIIVTDSSWSEFEQEIANELRRRNIPFITVFNKIDLEPPRPSGTPPQEGNYLPLLRRDNDHSPPSEGCPKGGVVPVVKTQANIGRGVAELRAALFQLVPDDFLRSPPIVSDLVPEHEMVLLVVPIDKEAPKGRLILPQVQTIRDLLDGDRSCVVVKTDQLQSALDRMTPPPALVVTDSQAFGLVAKIIPPTMPLTSFSILFARQKGNVAAMVAGARVIGTLKPNDKVLIAETCTHHPIEEDIGTVKIPNMLNKRVGGTLRIDHVSGHDFPDADGKQMLGDYRLVIPCGACMWNRREMLSRILHCEERGVPITNYGLALAFLHGILDRAVEPLIPRQ